MQRTCNFHSKYMMPNQNNIIQTTLASVTRSIEQL